MYFSTAIAFAALPFLVGAVPVSLKSSRTNRPISIPLSKRSNFLNRDGVADPDTMQAGLNHASARFEQALDVYERNTGEPHPLALKRGDSNERRIFVPTPLKSANMLVTADIAVGSPARAYTVTLDMTTPDMFLSDRSCSNCLGKNRYDISVSSTGTPVRSNTTVNFGSGKVDGQVITDIVSVGGNSVNDQTILVASSVTTSLQNFTADGAIGLGLNKTSTLGTGSFLESLIGSGGLSYGEPVIGLHLTPSGGELIVGGRDSSKYKGELAYTNIDTQGFWKMPLDSIAINGSTVVTAKEAIIDTSDFFIAGDNETISKIYCNIPGSASIPNSGLWQVPCDVTMLIEMTLGGTKFEIPCFATNIRISGTDNLCYGPYATLDNISNSTVRVGTVFMDHYYIELDPVNMKMGMAPSIY